MRPRLPSGPSSLRTGSSSESSDEEGESRQRRGRRRSGIGTTPTKPQAKLWAGDDVADHADATSPTSAEGCSTAAPEAPEASEGVFEIRDFTNASTFERITHQCSLAVKKWAALLRESNLEDGQDQLLREEFPHLDFTYELLFQFTPQEAQLGSWGTELRSASTSAPAPSTERLGLHSFPTRPQRLQRWFGVQHFVILSVRETAIDCDSARTVLSALVLGVKNAVSSLPSSLPPLCSFVPIETTRRRRYVGEVSCGGWRSTFATDQTNRVDRSLEHLSGLLEYFGSKYVVDIDAPGQILTVGARFIYLADTFVSCNDDSPLGLRATNLERNCINNPIVDESREADKDNLRRPDSNVSGNSHTMEMAGDEETHDAVEAIQLHCLWPSFPRNSFTDDAFYSELDPRSAPYWKLRVHLSEEAPLPLTKKLRTLLEFRKEAEAVRSAEHSVQPQMPKSVMASLSYVIQESLESVLLPTLAEMSDFVDSCVALPISAAPREQSEPRSSLLRLRGVTRGTRLARIAEVCAEMKCFKGALTLWCKVLAQMRHHWDTLRVHPAHATSPCTVRRAGSGVRVEHFDTSACLVQQKFEMLQRSTEARLQLNGGDSKLLSASLALNSGETKQVRRPCLSLPSLMTEDMVLQRDMAVACITDPDERMSELHGRELRSDMAAFKAVNLDLSLSDFLQWRETTEGLSSAPFSMRFLEECWQGSSPLASGQQALQLFEPEREAEMVLHYLENIDGTQLLLQLVQSLLRVVLEELSETAAGVSCDIHGSTHLRVLRERAVEAALMAFEHRPQTSEDGTSTFADVADFPAESLLKVSEFPADDVVEDAVTAIESFEAAVRLAISLRAKLPGDACADLLDSLLREGEATVTTQAQRRVVEDLFNNCHQLARENGNNLGEESIFEALPLAKEFVILLQPTGLSQSKATLGATKRLYAEIRSRHLRLATMHGIRIA